MPTQNKTERDVALCDPRAMARELAIIIPAYNEAANIADTIRSLQQQTCTPGEIIVIDDFSHDGTGDIARSLGVTVLRPPQNTGSKAGAQNFALKQITKRYVMALDADTTLASDAVEKLLPALCDENVAAACGFVIPRRVHTTWERGRYIEYLFAFTFYKQVQDYFGKPLISSGCFSVYNARVLKEQGGWSTRTMAEDMDLTWCFYQKGYAIRFIPEARCYPIEPHNFHFMRKQLRRWSHGLVQNLQLHGKGILRVPYLRFMLAVMLWDATVASLAYYIVLPLLAVYFGNPIFLLGYIIDFPTVIVPPLVSASERGMGEVWRVVISLPSFFVLRFVNGFFIMEAFWSEMIMRKRLVIYEKGH